MDGSIVRVTTSFRWPNDGDVPTEWHQARLRASASALGWESTVARLSQPHAVVEIEEAVEYHLATNAIDRTRAHKITLQIASNGHIMVSSAELSGPLYNFRLLDLGADSKATLVNVYLAPGPTEVSIFTMHKTSVRNHYDHARKAVSVAEFPPTTAEVLLYNQRSEIMEASLSTVYFRRGDRWITPRAASGCNIGLTRALALERGWCHESPIHKSELRNGEMIKLSNCVRGFWSGQIVLVV